MARILSLLVLPFALASGTAQELPAPDKEVFHQAVEWSPDGKWLAFSEFSGGEFSLDKWTIYVVAADGTERREVAKGLFCSWSPDGKRIVFDARTEDNWDIFIAEVESGEVTRVTEHEADDSQPAWSPRGNELAFASDREGNLEIHLLDLESKAVRRVTDDEAKDFNPAWSPDGERIVFYREKGDRKDQVHVVGRHGEGERRITSGEGHHIYPSFLPDGQVGYVSVGEERNKDLVRSKVDGTGVERIEGIPVSYARWSPDGKRVAFVAGRWPKSAVYVMDADGTGARKVVN